MEIKFSEIALLVVAIVTPIAILVLSFIPGGFNWIPYLLSHPVWQPVIFYGGAILLFGVLAWRIYRRIRPAPRKPDTIRHVSPTKMPKVEGSEAVRRYREGGSPPTS
jgi:hypothetical protein